MRRLPPASAVLIGICAACSKPDPPSASAPRASASATPAPMGACQSQPASFTIGTASDDLPPDDDDLGMPFGVELGGAVALPTHFAVAALTEDHAQHHAVVALVQDDGRGRTVDLGSVHGDVTPPLLAARADRIFAVVVDSDASASVLRVHRIDVTHDKPIVTAGPDLARDSDDSPAFGVAVGGEQGVVVWDDWDDKGEHSVIRRVTFAPDDLSHVTASAKISAEDADAESPRVVERADGFWAAWIVNARVDRKPKHKPADDEAPTEELGPRWIVLAPLDRAGNPHGHGVNVTAADGHVLSFDIATAADGGALVVWREDSTSRATPGGTIRLAYARADGSVDKRVLADDDVGSTVPELLPDELSPAEAKVRWVAFAANDETTRFGALDARGQILKTPETEPSMFGADPLAARSGKILSAKPKGRRAELAVLPCGSGASK